MLRRRARRDPADLGSRAAAADKVSRSWARDQRLTIAGEVIWWARAPPLPPPRRGGSWLRDEKKRGVN